MSRSTAIEFFELSTESSREELLTEAGQMWERVWRTGSFLSFQAYRKWLEDRGLALQDLGIEGIFEHLEKKYLDKLIEKYAADEQANPGTRAVDLLYLLEQNGLDADAYGLDADLLRRSVDQAAGILYQSRSMMKKLGLAPILNSDSYQ